MTSWTASMVMAVCVDAAAVGAALADGADPPCEEGAPPRSQAPSERGAQIAMSRFLRDRTMRAGYAKHARRAPRSGRPEELPPERERPCVLGHILQEARATRWIADF